MITVSGAIFRLVILAVCLSTVFGQVIAEYEKPAGEDEAFARSFVYGNGIDEVLTMFLPEKSFDPNDVAELSAFCEDWLTSNTTYDYDSSGVVDFNDFAVLAADGASLPATKETRFYYLKDALGSAVGIVGGRFQRESDREFYLYDVYGKPSDSSAPSAAGNPYFFTGRRLDPESGLYYYRARIYDPETGRFLQTDPIGYADSTNLYEYVVSNPTNWVDPLGLLYGWMHPGGKSLPQAGDPIDPITKTLSETAGTVAMVPFVFKAQLDCVGGGICDFLSDPKGNMSMLLDSLGQFSEGVIERNVEIYIKVKDSSQPLKTFAQEEIKWGKEIWGPVGINALEGYCNQIDRATSDDFWESCKGRAEITIVITQFYYAGKGVLQAGKQVINNADNLADDIVINSSGQANSGCAVRSRVMANIRESQAARAASNIDVLFAKEAQLQAGYAMDAWSMTSLTAGSIVYGGIPGQSAFYTDAATVIASDISRANLFQSLQAAPNPLRGYRPAVSMYQVMSDIRVPTGISLANPAFGPGGGTQFYIGNYLKYLRTAGDIELGR
ncbi:MAG TPA: RHS repeat-associated core domain-containing protein [Anaerohalosphaeraceae bacterium]|nr:RHS repeat-associated core domain-containing protein [Anaerohalosphaeraceae bacterium]